MNLDLMVYQLFVSLQVEKGGKEIECEKWQNARDIGISMPHSLYRLWYWIL